jgi:hypothetical protein
MTDPSRAPRILLRAGKDPLLPLTAEEVVLNAPTGGLFGMNAGNMLFQDAVHRILSVPGADVTVDQLRTERGYPALPAAPFGPVGRTLPSVRRTAAHINAHYDMLVLPLANAFRVSLLPALERLASVIERLRIPVVVVGVGVQRPLNAASEPLPDDIARVARRFLSAVLDRSATVGVRGEITQAALVGLGFSPERIDVIGCPSLYARGAGLRIERRVESLTRESPFTVNVSPYLRKMNAFAADHAQRYPRMTYIPQVLPDLRLMLWAEQPVKLPHDNAPQTVHHPLYRENRMRFFVDSATWIDYLRTQEFSVGSRIHGNIAALRAGTPAMVLAHDTRTLEIAQYHEIPHRRLPDLGDGEADAALLYDEADYAAFNAGHAARFAVFRDFLDRNGVSHVFADGRENPAYDDALANAGHAAAVNVRFPGGAGDDAGAEYAAAVARHEQQIAKLGRRGRPTLPKRLVRMVRR